MSQNGGQITGTAAWATRTSNVPIFGSGGGPVSVNCASIACGEQIALCVMDITDTDGLFGGQLVA